jgi:hypothetical protein
MTDQLFPIETATTDAEFVGFETARIIEPARPEAERGKRAASVPAKPRRQRAKKAEKRVSVRVWFDHRELAKLDSRAAAQGMALPEYLRLRALRDPRVRNRQVTASTDDLFARAEITQTTVVRLNARLSPEMEERVTAYFSSGNRLIIEPRDPPVLAVLPSRLNVLAKLTQLLTVLVGTRWPGQRATPPART